MEYIVLGVCAATVALGVVALVTPGSFAELLSVLDTSSGLWTASGLRIVLGIALYLAGPNSRAPGVLTLLGILFVAAGLLIPVLGRKRLARTVELFLAGGPWLSRAWGVVAILFGVSVGYAVLP